MLRPCLPVLLAAVLVVSCGGRGARWPVPLAPAQQGADRYSVRDGCQVFEGADFTVSVCPVDWIDAEGVYSAGGMKNPFGDEVDVMSRLVFFAVGLENRSGEKLFFNPIWASLVAGSAVPRAPLDVSDIYRINRESGDVEERARAFRETVFDGTLSVAGGEETEGWLVFMGPKDDFDMMTVLLQDMYLGGREYDLTFGFRPDIAGH